MRYEQRPVSKPKTRQADGPKVTVAQGAAENATANAIEISRQAR
jgi:hypothetical protein